MNRLTATRNAALLALAGFAAPAALADNFTWVGASGNWSTLAHWRQGGATPAQRPPGRDDDVTINFTSPGSVVCDAAPDNLNRVSLSVKSLSLQGYATLTIPQADAVRRDLLGVTATAGNITISASSRISGARGAGANTPGCDIEIQATGAISVAGQVLGGNPLGTGTFGGSVKLVSTLANPNIDALDINGTLRGADARPNTTGNGGNVTLQATNARIKIFYSGLRGGDGATNNAGNGGNGGSVSIYTNNAVNMSPGPVLTTISGGNGGSGTTAGGSGGDVVIGGAVGPVGSLNCPRFSNLSGGRGGNMTVAAAGSTAAAGDAGSVWLNVNAACTLDNTVEGGSGGWAASLGNVPNFSRTRGGRGGDIDISAGSLTMSANSRVKGGLGYPGDYAGGGGNVQISAAGNILHQGQVTGGGYGTSPDNRIGRITDTMPGEVRAINGAGGTIDITCGGNFTVANRSSWLIAGQGGGAMAPNGTALRGNSWKGGDVLIQVWGTFTDAGTTKFGRGGRRGDAKWGPDGAITIRGAALAMAGDVGRPNTEDDGFAASTTSLIAHNITLLPGLNIDNETVILNAENGRITADQDPALGQPRIHADSEVFFDVGDHGALDFSDLEPETFGPLVTVDPINEDDSNRVHLPPMDEILLGDELLPLIIPETLVYDQGCSADFNGDGFLDFFDLDAFTACFEGAECPAGSSSDFNNDGFTDFFDLDDFIAAFEHGC